MPEWKLKTGERVVSHHLAKRYWDATEAALAQEDGSGCHVVIVDVDINEKVMSWVVPTTQVDQIFYSAVHNTRHQLSRFVVGKEPQLVPGYLMLTLKWRQNNGGYFLVKTAGRHGYIPSEPWEEESQFENHEWWTTHAYIYDSRNTQLQSAYTWRHNLIHCYVCSNRRNRNTAQVIGDLQICKICFDNIVHGGHTSLRHVYGWGLLRVPSEKT